MTDEGQMGYPMDAVEFANAMQNMAAGTRAFYLELKQQGFTYEEAMKLAVAYIAGLAGGKVS